MVIVRTRKKEKPVGGINIPPIERIVSLSPDRIRRRVVHKSFSGKRTVRLEPIGVFNIGMRKSLRKK